MRAGFPVGCKVTLRGARMYEFLDRLVNIAMPRIRDFRGISARAFDGRGNYNIGIKEQIIFPEIEYDKIDAIRGMNIAITTTAKTDNEAKALLAAFRFPFKPEDEATVWPRPPSINREKKRRETVEEVRGPAQAAARDREQPEVFDEEGGGAREAAEAAARRLARAAPEPLRAYRAPARRVPQVRAWPAASCASSRCTANPGRDQGELVRRRK